MSAAKKLHALRGDDSRVVDAGPALNASARLQQQQLRDTIVAPAAREEERLAPRKLTVGEKLAEGRGFWRGVVIGGMMGSAFGVFGAAATFSMWAPLIQEMARDYLVLGGLMNQ